MKRFIIFATLFLSFSANSQNPDAIRIEPTVADEVFSFQTQLNSFARERAAVAYRMSPRPSVVTLSYLIGAGREPETAWNPATEQRVLDITRQVAPGCMVDPAGVIQVWKEFASKIDGPTRSSYIHYNFIETCSKRGLDFTDDGMRLARTMDGLYEAAALKFYQPVHRHTIRLQGGAPIYNSDNPAPRGYKRLQETKYLVEQAEAKLSWAYNNPNHRFAPNMIHTQQREIARACRRDQELARIDGGEHSASCARLRYAYQR